MVDDAVMLIEENADVAGPKVRIEGLNDNVKPCGEIADRETAPVRPKLVACIASE
jgi:hypothetical protein